MILDCYLIISSNLILRQSANMSAVQITVRRLRKMINKLFASRRNQNNNDTTVENVANHQHRTNRSQTSNTRSVRRYPSFDHIPAKIDNNRCSRSNKSRITPGKRSRRNYSSTLDKLKSAIDKISTLAGLSVAADDSGGDRTKPTTTTNNPDTCENQPHDVRVRIVGKYGDFDRVRPKIDCRANANCERPKGCRLQQLGKYRCFDDVKPKIDCHNEHDKPIGCKLVEGKYDVTYEHVRSKIDCHNEHEPPEGDKLIELGDYPSSFDHVRSTIDNYRDRPINVNLTTTEPPGEKEEEVVADKKRSFDRGVERKIDCYSNNDRCSSEREDSVGSRTLSPLGPGGSTNRIHRSDDESSSATTNTGGEQDRIDVTVAYKRLLEIWNAVEVDDEVRINNIPVRIMSFEEMEIDAEFLKSLNCDNNCTNIVAVSDDSVSSSSDNSISDSSNDSERTSSSNSSSNDENYWRNARKQVECANFVTTIVVIILFLSIPLL